MAEIDDLIEHGLNLYGQGDLDGALLAWEQALVVDPDNAQANSYVDYVRMNYELLTGEVENAEQQAPFGIDDEPYQIEILPAEAAHLNPDTTQSQARTNTADMDAGWFMDEERSQPNRLLELTADEPPAVNFEDQTREYAKEGRGSSDDFASVTPGVDTSVGFGAQPTNVKERDTGFVRATTRPDTSGGASARSKRPSQVPPELKMTLRTPGDTTDPYGGMDLPTDDAPPASADIALSYDDPSAGSDAAGPDTKPLGSRSKKAALPPEAEELIATLPTPTRTGLGAPPVLDDDDKRPDTRDLPQGIRPPAPVILLEADLPPEIELLPEAPPLSATITHDFETQKTNAAQSKIDVNAQPTRELPNKLYNREMVSAPTRDLGLRAMGSDEEPTGHRKPMLVSDRNEGNSTRADVILPFDPIDARSAQILDDIDDGAPDRESKEDKTRRRITALFERAMGWAQAHELDKAVASIDLALSEDPNSALAQKLIHRHRDTMMQVFQQFLGDLDRQPVLARPLHELANAPISPRAAFLLSRIDGALSLDELLDVSGMPRIEAYRYLCQLFLRGILR